MSLIPFTVSDRRDESDQIQQKASREGGFTCEGLSQWLSWGIPCACIPLPPVMRVNCPWVLEKVGRYHGYAVFCSDVNIPIILHFLPVEKFSGFFSQASAQFISQLKFTMKWNLCRGLRVRLDVANRSELDCMLTDRLGSDPCWRWLYKDYTMTIRWLYKDYAMTIRWLYKDCTTYKLQTRTSCKWIVGTVSKINTASRITKGSLSEVRCK